MARRVAHRELGSAPGHEVIGEPGEETHEQGILQASLFDRRQFRELDAEEPRRGVGPTAELPRVVEQYCLGETFVGHFGSRPTDCLGSWWKNHYSPHALHRSALLAACGGGATAEAVLADALQHIQEDTPGMTPSEVAHVLLVYTQVHIVMGLAARLHPFILDFGGQLRKTISYI